MDQLSRLSRTILDYATSCAKRSWSDSVTIVHLVAGVHRWDKDWFESTFPGVSKDLETYLERNRGDSLKPGSVDPLVIAYLERVSQERDLKDLTSEFLELIGGDLKVSPETTSEVRVQSRASGEVDDAESERPAVQRQEGPSLQLNRSLVAQVAGILGRPIDEVVSVAADDGRVIALRILGRDDKSIVTVLGEALGDSGRSPDGRTLSAMLREVVDQDQVESSRAATQLALAFVDLAEHAASLDDVITDEEIERIDEVRLECRSILANKIDATSDAIIEFERRFGELVGMDAVKKDLRKRVDFLMVSKKRAQRGRDTEAQRMHMAFVGNPGTGKTTVARLFGQLLNNLGLLPSDVFIEKDRSGLVGTHVGQTEEKTKNVIRQAEGGVLFIDEAYALNDRYGNQKGFGEEAVDVLVKEMEDKRDQLVVVLAGYKRPMEHFLTINPGLKSRIPSVIDFPDYSINELMEIADRIAGRRDLVIDDSARVKITKLVELVQDNEGFGNAREVENIMDASQRNMTQRLSPLGNLATDQESRTIVADDIPTVDQAEKSRHIGFGRHLYL